MPIVTVHTGLTRPRGIWHILTKKVHCTWRMRALITTKEKFITIPILYVANGVELSLVSCRENIVLLAWPQRSWYSFWTYTIGLWTTRIRSMVRFLVLPRFNHLWYFWPKLTRSFILTRWVKRIPALSQVDLWDTCHLTENYLALAFKRLSPSSNSLTKKSQHTRSKIGTGKLYF